MYYDIIRGGTSSQDSHIVLWIACGYVRFYISIVSFVWMGYSGGVNDPVDRMLVTV